MNRKLLNGLLVMALAAGGVGTFTSCKDEDFRNDVLLGQESLEAQIEAIRQVKDSEFQTNLKAWLDDQTKRLSGGDNAAEFDNYDDLVMAAATMWQTYNDILKYPNPDLSGEAKQLAQKLYDWMFKNYFNDWKTQIDQNKTNIQTLWDELYGKDDKPGLKQQVADLQTALKDLGDKVGDIEDRLDAMDTNLEDIVELLNKINQYQYQVESALKAIQANLAKQVTSLNLNQTVNPVFGTVNLPLGIKSTMLATYLYLGKNELVFPSGITAGDLSSATLSEENINTLKVIEALQPEKEATLNSYQFTEVEEGDGNMGNAYITINPTSVNFDDLQGLSIVNAKGETILDGLTAQAYDGDLYFGASRADNVNVYEVPVTVTADNWGKLGVELKDKSEIVSAVKDVIKNHKLTDVASLAKVIYDNMQNVMPAYALSVSWEEEDVNLDAWDGEDVELVQPDNGESPDPSAPEAGVAPQADDATDAPVATKTVKSVLSSFDLAAAVVHPLSYNSLQDLGGATDRRLPMISPLKDYLDRIGNKLTFTIKTVTYKDIEFNIDFGVEPGTLIIYSKENPDEILAELTYGGNGINNPAPGSLDELIKSIQDGFEGSLDDVAEEINKQLKQQIETINENLEEMQAKLDDVQKLIDDLKASKKLGYAQKLVNIYNKIAEKVNNFIADPSYYTQVLAAYEAGDGIHLLSEDPYMGSPVPVSTSADKGMTIYLTSYTGDIAVPSYKKYVAVTAYKYGNDAWSTNTNMLSQFNAKLGLNEVVNGTQPSVTLDFTDSLLSSEPMSLRISYLSVDYHGVVSMKNYYVALQ